MAVYTVHIPARYSGSSEALGERTEFVADKFCWPALFFALLWMIWHRMWWVLAGYIVLTGTVAGLANLAGVNDTAMVWISLAAMLLFASEAASLRRWSLSMKGYRLVAVVTGHDRDDCERRFFDGWVPQAPASPDDPVSPSASSPMTARPVGPQSSVIGLFPTPGARQ